MKRSKTKIILGVLIVLGALFVVGKGVDVGRGTFSCKKCGARSSAMRFYFYGQGGYFGRSVEEGIVSKLIQQHDGQTCAHDWRYASGSEYGFFYATHGLGMGFSRYSWSAKLDDWLGAEDYLKKRSQEDPQFVAKLQRAIAYPTEKAQDAFLNELYYELFRHAESLPAP